MFNKNSGYLKKAVIIFTLTLLVFSSCTKENLPPPPSSADGIGGKTVRYTVLVVSGGNSSFKSTNGLDSTIVSVVMNDSIYNSRTDFNGIAKFNNLASGVIAVSIKHANFTTANLIVDLTAKSDTGYDSNNLRNAATMVALFPTKGIGTANISGRVFADLNLTTAGLEVAPTALQVTAMIEPKQLKNYINHNGDGEILSLSYDPSVYKATTNIDGDFNISVPASGSGLKIVLTANDFQFNQVTGIGTSQRKIYRTVSDTIAAVSGMTYLSDLIYK